ncbi:MAG: hypothetical protein NTZ75_09120 [Euryarchaeota archaeon]|nr:hypothetical protein [Euryarchaeota archaeon]
MARTTNVLIVAVIITLLISPFFSFAFAQGDVDISIKGGFGCHILINNHSNDTVNGSINITADGLFRHRSEQANIVIMPFSTLGSWIAMPGIISLNVSVQAGGILLTRHGFSIMYITFFLP